VQDNFCGKSCSVEGSRSSRRSRSSCGIKRQSGFAVGSAEQFCVPKNLLFCGEQESENTAVEETDFL
jgi:hypothetical protein